MSEKKGHGELGTFYIDNGAVIDHLLPGTSIRISKLIGIKPVNISEEYSSGKHDKKDRITIPVKKEDAEKRVPLIRERLEDPELLIQLALLSPRNSISIVVNGDITRDSGGKKEKFYAKIPDEIRGYVRCPNGNCISGPVSENVPLRIRYAMTDGEHEFTCHYCGRKFDFETISIDRLLTYQD